MNPLKKLSWLWATCVRRLIPFCQGIVLVLAVGSLGCGRDSADSTAVPPPSPSSVGVDAPEQSPAESSAPGEIVLPDGDIPASPPVDAPSTSGGIEMPKDVVVPNASQSTAAPAIQYETWKEIESVARSSGRVTVVDLWSLACDPCLKEFPGLVRLHQTMGDKVQCIAVDLDFDGRKSRPPEYYEQQVVEFLSSVDAEGFPMYICSTPSDDVFATAKIASIPTVFVFTADGEVAKVFVDAGETAGFSYEKDIVPLVTKLVE